MGSINKKLHLCCIYLSLLLIFNPYNCSTYAFATGNILTNQLIESPMEKVRSTQ